MKYEIQYWHFVPNTKKVRDARRETTRMTLDNDDDATPNGGMGGRCGSRGNASRSPDGAAYPCLRLGREERCE